MTQILRYDGNLKPFADDALGTERTIFGAETQDDTLDLNINTDFFRGWGIVGVNGLPTKQDFNAFAYTSTALSAYLYQMGVPEWNASQEYYAGAITNVGGSLFKAVVDTIGDDPSTDDGSNWLTVIPDAVDFASDTEAFAGSLDDKALTPANFGVKSHTSNGYQRLAGGLILQLAEGASSSSESTQTITFPISFPTACLAVFPSHKNDSNNPAAAGVAELISFTSTNTLIRTQFYTANGIPVTPLIFAIGY